jgi:ribosomal protein S27E
MDLTGGGVMQSESTDKGFKYITCKDCGKEQVYGKHQVKCRDCGKNFSLTDLYALVGR